MTTSACTSDSTAVRVTSFYIIIIIINRCHLENRRNHIINIIILFYSEQFYFLLDTDQVILDTSLSRQSVALVVVTELITKKKVHQKSTES